MKIKAYLDLDLLWWWKLLTLKSVFFLNFITLLNPLLCSSKIDLRFFLIFVIHGATYRLYFILFNYVYFNLTMYNTRKSWTQNGKRSVGCPRTGVTICEMLLAGHECDKLETKRRWRNGAHVQQWTTIGWWWWWRWW